MSKPPHSLTGLKLPTDQPQISAGLHPLGPIAPAGIFSTDAHESEIKTKGMPAIHWRHALNPNRTTIEGGVDLSQSADINGYNLYDPRPFYIVPTNQNWEDTFVTQGLYGKHSASILHTGYYDDPLRTRVYLRPNDIILVNNGLTVMITEMVEYKPAGLMRLKFPIVSIDYMANGQNVRFEEGSDFIIQDGMLEWVGQNRPTWDTSKARGEPLSVVYWTYPYYMVAATPRVFRTVYTNASGNAALPSVPTYLPGSAIVQMLWLEDAGSISIPNWPREKNPLNKTNNTRS